MCENQRKQVVPASLLLLITQQNSPRRERPGLHKCKGHLLTALLEETFPASYNNRIDHQTIFIDEVVLLKSVDKIATPVNQHILIALLLDPRYGGSEIALDQAGIPPHLLQGRGNDIFGQTVHAICHAY